MKAITTILLVFLCASINAQIIFPVAAKRGKIGGNSGSTPDTLRVKVNLFASGTGIGAISTTGWNDKGIAAGSNISLASLNYDDGSASPVTCVISAISNLNDNNTSTPGFGNTGNTTEFPNGTFRMSPSNSSNPVTLAINNIPSGATSINFKALASRVVGGSRLQRFTNGSVFDIVEPQNNLTDIALLTGLIPSSNTVVINISSEISTGTSVYLNAFIIEIIIP